MAQLSREEFMARINTRIGDDNSEEALAFVADMADTFDGLSTSGTDTVSKSEYDQLKGRYDQLSANYKERFMSGTGKQQNDDDDDDDNGDEQLERAKSMRFNDLFTTKK